MEQLFVFAEYVIYGLLFVSLVAGIYISTRFSTGALSALFSSFAYSIFFIGVYFVFMRSLEDVGYYSDVSLHMWAHVIVYFSMIALIWGARHVRKISEAQTLDTNQTSGIAHRGFFWSMTALLFVLLLLSVPFEGALAPLLTGSVVDTLGIHHFSVFVLGGMSAWYLYRLKGDWGMISTSLNYFIAFLVLIGLQHFWETVTESWQLVHLDSVFIEGVEMLIIIPALILLFISQWKVMRAIK